MEIRKLNINVQPGDTIKSQYTNDMVDRINDLIDITKQSQFESVSLHVTSYDGQATLEGLTIGIVDSTASETLERTLDEEGNCTFDIPKDHTYTISMPSISGYAAVPPQTFVASLNERSVLITYYALASNYETAVIHCVVYNKNLVDITSTDTDFIGLQLSISVQGEANPRTVALDNNHSATLSIEYGKEYSFTLPTKEGYKVRYNTTFTAVAGIPQRAITIHYMEWNANGIYGVKANGSMYDYSAIEAMTASERAEIIAIALNTSRLQEANAGFMYKLPNTTIGRQWAAQNVEFDKTFLPFKQSHAVAVLDMNGATNTNYIRSIGDDMNIETPAADWCVSQTLTIDDVEKHGFLGSFGQMYALSENIAVLNAIHTLLGKALPGFTSSNWWSSTQYSATNAVSMTNGAFYGNFSKTGSLTTVALFAL